MSDSLRESTVAEMGLRQPIRTPFERWPHGTDLAIAVLAFSLTLAMWEGRDELDLNTFTGVGSWLTAFVASLALLWRRSHATQTHTLVIAASVLAWLTPLADGMVAMAFTLYSVGRYEPNTRTSLIAVTAAFAYLLVDLRLLTSPSVSSTIAAGMAFGIWYVGRRLRFRGEYLRLLEERAHHLEREQHADTERAVVAERTRIAREMHDVVAHKVSLMTVQAGAARTVASSDPCAAGEAMSAVETAGRQALTEMRSLLDVLRPATSDEALLPQPALADLPALMEQVRDAGVTVTLKKSDDLDDLTATQQLTIYRIVQEALTNVIKHAGDNVTVIVEIRGTREHVDVGIIDDGTGVTTTSPNGHGIVGMRERAALTGGTLDVRSRQPGFEVRARFPRQEPTS